MMVWAGVVRQALIYSVRTAPIQVTQHVTNLLFKPNRVHCRASILIWQLFVSLLGWASGGWMDGQVKVDNGYKLLSTYLNRIFEDQERLKQQYDKVYAI